MAHFEDTRKSNATFSRRNLILTAAAACWGVLLLPALSLVKGWKALTPAGKLVELDLPSVDGVFLVDQYILARQKGKVRIFSRACTHLGCRLELDDNAELICPCHGSRFSQQGKATKGPATRSLVEYRFAYHPKNSQRLVVQGEL